ncbi:enhancer of mRNA-decapping protein 4-like [Colias croceus]|uniref:enhancer of mRNA-decapping protein 4-like n=1 Tax=Colias crocea TaxID=72248 RepID=UPI001E2801DB|nr:enhancer of mRNA-decapping protein 4-like [Colias croceus]
MQPTTMLPKLSDTTQTISFSEEDDTCSAEVFATDVVVTSNLGNHNHGSSKVKLTNLVDYNWEAKFYPGRLIDVHNSGKYLAYCIKAPSSVDGMVRVVYLEPGVNERSLIKGMKGEVQDLAFAFIQNQVLLACIDELGYIYVHEIELIDNRLRCTLMVEIQEDTGMGGSAHLLAWCPYIPDEEDDSTDDDVAKMLLTTHSNVARMWNVREVCALATPTTGATPSVAASTALARGAGRTAGSHAAPLRAAAFSPDGTALATAADDGYVMFAQVYINSSTSPRCLHKWQPHEGKPLTCLFFLDNHKNYNADVQFWKFAVTGADNNTNIKIWSCKSWTCLQSITFTPPLGAEPALGMKAQLDISANYLLLSDFKARSLYVLNMARDGGDSAAYCRSVAEFLLPYQVLGFCIVDAEEQAVKCESRCEDPFHRNGSAADDSPTHFDLHDNDITCADIGAGAKRTRLRLYLVQPKGLQEADLLYMHRAPETHTHDMLQLDADVESLTLEEPTEDEMPANILQQQTQQLKNLLMRAQPQPNSLINPRPESPSSMPQLNLMTPDAFSSPGKRDEEEVVVTAQENGNPLLAAECEEEVLVSEGSVKQVSGGSSPSREVQQIMSHNDYYKEEEEEESQPSPEEGETTFPADLYVSPEKPPPPAKLQHSNSDVSWPQISLAQITEANQRKASSDKTSQPLPAPPVPVDDVTRAKLDALEEKIDKLTELVTAQSREVRAARGEARSAREQLERVLHDHAQQANVAMETAFANGWERIARIGESAGISAAQAAGLGATRTLEQLSTNLQREVATKLAATDQMLRTNIDKIANSKVLADRLSSLVAGAVGEAARAALRDALLEQALPLMEKAHAQVFRQINQAFQAGTKEFAANTEAAARAAAERGGAAAAASLRAALEQHADALARAAPLHPQHFAAQLQEVAHSVLEKEMSWWREQARSVAQASRAHSPATPALSLADRQLQVSQIQSLIMNGDVNGAFQLALSASDLSLVVGACRGAEPARVFGPPCRLKQHVLLSLVQQLAADMARDTHLKQRYLEEAVMNLDTTNPVTREHLPTVIRELQKQILSFLQANPGHGLTRQFRMLLMATEALVKNTA